MNKLKIAVVGSGISGLSAAWLLAKTHDVVLFEAQDRFGGHSHTERLGIDEEKVPVDLGFIVFNEKTYPNLVALFRHLSVETLHTEMGFSVSLNSGRTEYSGGSMTQLLGSGRTAFSASHWVMLTEIARFYRSAKRLCEQLGDDVTLGEFLKRHRFKSSFVNQHILPMAAAIWSSHPQQMLDYPAKAFVDFFDNHQLFELGSRDKWRTVKGGSINYVKKMISGLQLRKGDPVRKICRHNGSVMVALTSGHVERFDHVVIAAHANEALGMIDQPSEQEANLLGVFDYSKNSVVVHRDPSLMPTRRRHWSSWNYVGDSKANEHCVTYWMNALQKLPTKTDYFVSLNPVRLPDERFVEMKVECTHPIFTRATLQAQKDLWYLQGRCNIWFCGAYFGAGFHEDGLQSGLAVAEQLGGLTRPWSVEGQSSRIHIRTDFEPIDFLEAAE